MNIMELCLSPGRGGMELYMYRSVGGLLGEHKVFPVVAAEDGLIRRRLTADEIAFQELKVRVPELPLLAAIKLARWIDGEDVDVIHVHFRRDLPVASIAKRLSRKKPRLIYTIQMKVSHSKNDPYHNFIYGQTDVFLAITRQLQQQIRERLHPRFSERVHLLYYGTHNPEILDEQRKTALKQRFGIAPDSVVVGLFGQKHEGKGQHLLIEALGAMRKENMNVRGLIVGPPVYPEYEERLHAQVKRLGLEEHVTLLDYIENPQELMQICHCVVLATYQETFGLVLIEAMSVGATVVGSDAGGVPEIIDDGITGLLFRTRDASSLKDKLTVLCKDRELMRRLGRKGQEKAKEMFSTSRHYSELLKWMSAENDSGNPIANRP